MGGYLRTREHGVPFVVPDGERFQNCLIGRFFFHFIFF